jgi:hypothetical protein
MHHVGFFILIYWLRTASTTLSLLHIAASVSEIIKQFYVHSRLLLDFNRQKKAEKTGRFVCKYQLKVLYL